MYCCGGSSATDTGACHAGNGGTAHARWRSASIRSSQPASPASATVEHLQFLAQVARLLRQEETVADLLEAPDGAALVSAIRRRER